MPSIKEYMDLSQDSYNNSTNPSATDGWVEFTDESFTTKNDATGFFARVFQKGNDIVIAYRATDSLDDWMTDNTQLLLNKAMDQYKDAQNFSMMLKH